MDQRNFFPVAQSDSEDKDKETEDKPPKVAEMGFYETVASRQASVMNRRAFRVSMDEPSSDDLLEGQQEGSLTTPQVKLPLISNTAVIANSSSN